MVMHFVDQNLPIFLEALRLRPIFLSHNNSEAKLNFVLYGGLENARSVVNFATNSKEGKNILSARN